MTGLLADGVRLALVLGHAGVNRLDDIRADRGREDGRDGVGSSRRSTVLADDGNGRTRRHCGGSVAKELNVRSAIPLQVVSSAGRTIYVVSICLGGRFVPSIVGW